MSVQDHTTPLQPGDAVKIDGLSKDNGFNGQNGECIGEDPDNGDGRWKVKMSNGEIISVKSANLVKQTAGQMMVHEYQEVALAVTAAPDLEDVVAAEEDIGLPDDVLPEEPISRPDPCDHFSRFMSGPCAMALGQAEIDQIQTEYGDGMGRMAMRVLCWRNSTLFCTIPFFVVILALKVQKFLQVLLREDVALPAKGYMSYMDNAKIMEQVLAGAVLLGSVAGLIAVIPAKTNAINEPRRSQLWVMVTCAFCYLPAFLGFLTIPFSVGFDLSGLVNSVCHHTIDGFEADFNSAEVDGQEHFSSEITSVLEKLKAGHGLRADLAEMGIELPSDFNKICDKIDPLEWETELMDVLEKAGVLKYESHSNPALVNSCTAMSEIGALLRSNCPAECPQMCRPGGSCEKVMPYLLVLQTSSEFNIAALNSLAMAGTLRDPLKTCLPCVSNATTCTGCIAQVGSPLCMSTHDLKTFREMTTFVGHAKDLKLFLNLGFALEAIESLLPDALAVMEGMIYGGRIGRLMLSTSRLPSLLIGAAVIFTLPPMTMIFATITGFLGTPIISVAALFIVAAFAIFIPAGNFGSVKGMMDVANFRDAKSEMDARFQMYYIFKFFFAVLVVVYLFTDSNVEQYVKMSGYETVAGMVVPMLMNAFFTYFGKSRLTYMMFADILVILSAGQYYGPFSDDDKMVAARAERFRDLQAVYAKGYPEVPETPAATTETTTAETVVEPALAVEPEGVSA